MNSTLLRRMAIVAAAICIGLSAYAQTTIINHVVANGENLPAIAARYGTTVDQLIKYNPDAAKIVYVGMDLKIPVVAATPTATAAPAYTPATTYAAPAANPAPAPAPVATPAAAPVPATTNIPVLATLKDMEWGAGLNVAYVMRDYKSNKGGDAMDAKGFRIGCDVMGPIPQVENLCLLTGYKFDVLFWSDIETSDDDNEYEQTFVDMSFAIPASVGYRINLTDNIHITPYAGLFAKASIATLNEDITIDGKTKENSICLQSKKDMGNAKWNWFQLGYQAGVRVKINKTFGLYAEYAGDFTKVSKIMSANTIALGISIGM